MLRFPFASSCKEEDRLRIDGHSPSGGARPPASLLGALCDSAATASRTGVDELEDDDDGLEGADDGEVGAEILDDGAAALEPPGDSLDGVAGLRSVDWDLLACDPAASAAAADDRPAFGDGCLLGVAGDPAAALRLTAASSWPLP